jgi:hypothetical protein
VVRGSMALVLHLVGLVVQLGGRVVQLGGWQFACSVSVRGCM